MSTFYESATLKGEDVNYRVGWYTSTQQMYGHQHYSELVEIIHCYYQYFPVFSQIWYWLNLSELITLIIIFEMWC